MASDDETGEWLVAIPDTSLPGSRVVGEPATLKSQQPLALHSMEGSPPMAVAHAPHMPNSQAGFPVANGWPTGSRHLLQGSGSRTSKKLTCPQHSSTVKSFKRADYDHRMRQSGDIEARATEIDDLVGNGEYDQFIKRLIDFARDFGSRAEIDDGLIISGEFNSLEREKRQDVIDPNEYKRNLRQLMKRGLQLKSDVLNATALAA